MVIAIVLTLVISIINGYVFWWVSVSTIFLLALYYFDSKILFNPLTVVVLSLVLLLMLNMIFVRPSNDQDASYLIGFFLSGFLLCSYANKNFMRSMYYSLCALFLLLAIWGLIQYLTGQGYLVNTYPRANALFYTPNTYAACLNIILLPSIVIYLYNNGTGKLLALILFLFAALLVSQSRGGWVAFTSVMILVLIFARTIASNIDKKRIQKILLGFTLVFSVYSIIELVDFNKINFDFKTGRNHAVSGSIINNELKHLVRSESIVSTLDHRFMLYDIAWQQIKEKPLLGRGFHTFRYFQLRDQKEPYTGNLTRYVHNDYLQLWMETGIFGLILFVSIPLLLISLLFWLRNRMLIQDKVVVLALAVGLAGFYIQALVGFLFYTPFLLMLYGCYLGYINQLLNKYPQEITCFKLELSSIKIRPVIIKCLAGLVFVFYFSQPAIAQLAFDQANRDTRRLDIESALTAYELARRFAPYEPLYYLIEGNLWYHAAKATGKSEPAKRADKLFKQGVAANPYRVENLLLRAMLHRDVPELISNPAKLETVLSWMKHVLEWLPHDQKVQAEYIRTLFFMNEHERARQLLNVYLKKSPDSFFLKQVQAESEIYPEWK